jgi:hypothetical protein
MTKNNDDTIIEDGIVVYKNHFCQCPCHGRIPVRKSNKVHGIPKFIWGHQNGGKNQSLKTRLKMIRSHGINKPNLGISLSVDTKKKISLSVKKRYKEGYLGETEYDLYDYLNRCKVQSYKQGLGFNPLNTPFKHCSMHHIDEMNVIFIPVNIHRENWHQLKNKESMMIINSIAISFMDTPEEMELLIDSMSIWEK